MQQHIRVVWSILVIGAAATALAGCGGGSSDAAALPMPERHAPPALAGPEELVSESEQQLPAPDMLEEPMVEVPEKVEAAPDLPPQTPDAPTDPTVAGPEELEAMPEPAVLPPVHLDPAPVVAYRGRLHVGADVAAAADQLAAVGVHEGTNVSYGRVQDGVGADEVIAYLRQHAEVGDFKLDPGLLTFAAPPTVRLAEGTGNELADFVAQAVRLLNTALPQGRGIRFGIERVTPLEPMAEVPDGDIFIDFAPWEDWNDPYKPPRESAVALAQWAWQKVFDGETGERQEIGMRAGRIWVDRDAILTAWVVNTNTGRWEERVLSRRVEDRETLDKWYSDQAVVAILVHELLHTLGMGVHLDPDRFPNSIMNDHRNDYDGVTGHVLHPVDREALQAAYSVLEPGALPEQLVDDLGGWEDASLHLRGEIDTPRGGAFGVAVRNGLAQPWADGRMPRTALADNRGLSGTVSWSGSLLGFTPTLQAVGGAADLSIELETLAGQLDFTGLEHWEADAPPGTLGSGTRWGDGDLRYLLSVRGNTFEQTGGDTGAVTGAFFGHAHEAMGGVLERPDLTAAFGGTR